MPEKSIDYTNFIAQFETLLQGSNATVEDYKDGMLFKLQAKAPKGELIIKIYGKWVGYDFRLLGKNGRMGTVYWEDTDAYSLGFDPEATMKIFADVKRFTSDFINRKILIGEKDGVSVTARPDGKKNYEVTIHYPSKWWQLYKGKVLHMTEKELSSSFSLTPVEPL